MLTPQNKIKTQKRIVKNHSFVYDSSMRIAIFLGIIALFSLSITIFLGHVITTGFSLSGPLSWTVHIGIWLIFPLFIGGEILKRKKILKWGSVLGLFGLGTYSIAVAVFIWAYIAFILGFDKMLVTQTALAVTALLAFWAWIVYKKGPKVLQIDLTQHPILSSKSGRKTLVHLTDIHLTQRTSPQWLQHIVDQTNALHPDIIAFTGDLMDCQPSDIPHLIAILKQLKANHGKVAVSGNHDVMMGLNTYYHVCSELGFTVVDHAEITLHGLHFIGTPDEMTGHHTHVPEALPSDLPVILLKHRPTGFKKAVKKGVHLQLSGHAHKGQLPPWGLLVKLRYNKYAYGLHFYKKGVIFTSRGTGGWGPPMRLFKQSEIVTISL
jgi:predicted MPP superfamily phosphohydrolase